MPGDSPYKRAATGGDGLYYRVTPSGQSGLPAGNSFRSEHLDLFVFSPSLSFHPLSSSSYLTPVDICPFPILSISLLLSLGFLLLPVLYLPLLRCPCRHVHRPKRQTQSPPFISLPAPLLHTFSFSPSSFFLFRRRRPLAMGLIGNVLYYTFRPAQVRSIVQWLVPG